MPITPAFQSSPAAIIAGVSCVKSTSIASASARISCSRERRSALSAFSSPAMHSASCASSLRRRSTPRRAVSMRPAAFMRGPSWNPTIPVLIFLPSSPAAMMSARTPQQGFSDMRASPRRTILRFSPTSGTRSEIVPRAAMSMSSSHTLCFSIICIACTSLNATPTPARSLSG